MTAPTCLVTKMSVLVPISSGIGFITTTAKDSTTGNEFVVSQEVDLSDTDSAITEITGELSDAGYTPINLSALP